MARKGEIFGFGPRQILVGLIAVALVGSGVYLYTTDAQTASVNDRTVDVRGEFDTSGMLADDLESPFSTVNVFEDATVDEDGSDGLSSEVAWNLAADQDLGLEDATAVAVFETDGFLANVEVVVEDASDAVEYSLKGATVYDYERAVEADSLEAGQVKALDIGDETVSAEGTLAEATTLEDVPASTALSGGEYAVALDYKFESGVQGPASGDLDMLSNVTLEADTLEDDAVETIDDITVQLQAQ